VGRVKYLVSYHGGQKTHRDGSPFFDVSLFKNKRKMAAFVGSLKEKGYSEA
jgi:hypothetical protein